MSASLPIPVPSSGRFSQVTASSAVSLANGILPSANASQPATHLVQALILPSQFKDEPNPPPFHSVAADSPRGRSGDGKRTSRDSIEDSGRDLERNLRQHSNAENIDETVYDRDQSSHEVQLATSWPPPPRLTILSRSAVRWQNVCYGVADTRAVKGEAQQKLPHCANPHPSPCATASLLFPDFSKVASAVDSVQRALVSGRVGMEKPPREGVSGTYFFKRMGSGTSSSSKVTAVFKPADEEPGDSTIASESLVSDCHSPNRTQISSLPFTSPDWHDSSHSDRMSAAGFRHGEGAFKEVAVYILDHQNFAKVPQTALAEYELMDTETRKLRTRKGAFQVYVPNVGDADDWGPGIFPTEDVHRIAALDIRILNFDRHGGNILVTKSDSGSYGLVPIDHGFSLPDNVKSVPWAVWMDWPAAKHPVSMATKKYIANLDPDREACLLKDEFGDSIRSKSLLALKVATRLLQKGIVAGLSLYEIGLLIYCREGNSDMNEKSELEKVMDEAYESAKLRQMHIGESVATELENGLFQMDGPSATCLSTSRQPEDVVDNFVVKYACRRIDELIRNVCHRKDKSTGGLGAHCRARSIPDFCFQLRNSVAIATTVETKHPTMLLPSAPTGDRALNVLQCCPPEDPRRSFETRSCAELRQNMSSLFDGDLSSPVGTLKNRTVPNFGSPNTNGMSYAVSICSRGCRPPKMGGDAPIRKSSPVSPHQFDWNLSFSS